MRLFIKKFLPKAEKRPGSYSVVTSHSRDFFWQLGLQTVKELETEQGILASGRDEIYGAIFGRDSLITSLKLLSVAKQSENHEFLKLVRKVLLTLASLQGQKINRESGEEPGKIIHEYRTEKHEHLTKRERKAWYVYPDGVMRNYDSVDATSLFLICVYRFFQQSQDEEFLTKVLPSIRKALKWVQNFSDKNEDGLVDYQLDPDRVSGGLINQNWMDSAEASFHEGGEEVIYPLAPVEAQAYTYLALRLWSKFFFPGEPSLAYELEEAADRLKKIFNQKFVLKEAGKTYLAAGIDGKGKALRSARSSMGHTLWAALTKDEDGILDSVLEKKYVEKIVARLMQPDLFEPEAGIRTLSSLSIAFNPNSYHNGSIWPFDNSMIAAGFENFGFHDEAELVREALLKAVFHFKTPIELFVYDNTYLDYLSESGQTSCKSQAWSAAAILATVSPKIQTTGQTKTFIYRLNHKHIFDLITAGFDKKLVFWPVETGKKASRQAAARLEEISRQPRQLLKKLKR